jgi:DNA ligase-1
LSDELLRSLSKRLDALQVGEKPAEYEVDSSLEPDVWVRPEMVLEVAADNITESKMHTSGYGLRFPRLVKVRDDKGAEQAETLEEVVRLYELQGNGKGSQ